MQNLVTFLCDLFPTQDPISWLSSHASFEKFAIGEERPNKAQKPVGFEVIV